ncbi:MerR family transcriptional regulator [Nocardia farcinica]|uniref:DNA polymerase III subunit beta family protein n=1 Tax=Nocardia farcinica TaxID=37329 RepID=UPI002453F33E|nr:MerR family transcriptional regulator [Nocardia farcinica]
MTARHPAADQDDPLLTIGAMARASGLTASALRFYGDCGLLVPSVVDDLTGYRYYTPAQCERAVLIRRLREIEMPLPRIEQILSGDAARATELLDRHVAALRERARRAEAVAGELRAAFSAASTGPAEGAACVVDAAALAAAVAQVGPAAAREKTFPVLAGILLEADETGLTLTATDRYRLVTRSLALIRPGATAWSAVVPAAELAAAGHHLPSGEIAVTRDDTGVLLGAPGAGRLPVLDETFPDYRVVLDGLAPVRTRVLISRTDLLDLLDHTPDTPLGLDITPTGLTARRPGAHPIAATVTGPPLRIAFDPAVLRPAVDSALGPDLMLDLATPDRPVVVRSATDGDLTVLVMPVLDHPLPDHPLPHHRVPGRTTD